MKIDRAATDGAFGRARRGARGRAGPRRLRRARRGQREHGGRGARRHRRARPHSRRSTRCWRPAARGRSMPGTSRASSAINRVVCPPGAGAGSTIGMLMAPARVDRVASFNVALAGADFTAATRVFAGLEKESVDVLRLTGADIEHRTVRRLADMRYIGQGSEITVALPDPLTEAGRENGVRGGLQGAVRPHAAGGRDPVRRPAPVGQRADGGQRRRARTAAPSLGRGAEGHAAGVLPRRRQDAADAGVGPLCARSPA